MALVILTLILASSLGAVNGCPEECTCQRKVKMVVLCMNLKYIPKTIPKHAEYLSITNSSFEVLDSRDLKQLYQLRELYITNTPITKVNLLYGLEHLRMLLLTSTKMSMLNSLDFIGAPGLIGMGISQGELTGINITSGLEKLKYLTLYDNKLETLNSTTFKNLIHLERLGIQRNNIHKVAITAGLENLKFLSLDNNKLKAFDSKDYEGASKLEHISLIENSISTVGASAILPNLSKLSLNCNQIKKINSQSIVKHFPSLKKLELKNCKDVKSRNKIECDCDTWKLTNIKSVSGYCKDKDSRKLKIRNLEKDQVACT